MDTADIFLIPFDGRCVLHAPRHRVTALLNGAAADRFRRALLTGQSNGLDSRLKALMTRLAARTAPIPLTEGPFSPRQLCLLPTNDCNLRCLYCAPAAGDSKALLMSEEVCAAAVDLYASVVERDALPVFSVYLHGGEPFKAWELVRFAHERCRRHADRLGVPLAFTATSNAVMSPERAHWVATNFRFVIVSMDGPPEIHNRFRPTAGGQGSYDAVARTVRIFRDRGLAFGLRATVEKTTAHRMPEIAEFFCDEFQPPVVNFEPLIVCGRSGQGTLEVPDPKDFVNYSVAAGKVLRERGVRLMLTTAQTNRLAQSNCNVVYDNFVVTPDGLASACFGANDRRSPNVADFAYGEWDPQTGKFSIDASRLEKTRSYGVSNIPRCHDCFCKWHCSGGCRLFHTPPFCKEPPVPMCLVTQKLTLWRLLTDMGLYDEADRIQLEPHELAAVE